MSTFKICPQCGGQMIQPVAVYVICSDTRYTITAEGLREDCIIPNPTNGVIIIREFLCESRCCRWQEIEEFNHGSVDERFRELEVMSGPIDVMWRV